MNKETILSESKNIVQHACEQLGIAADSTASWLQAAKEKFRNIHGSDRIAEGQLIKFNDQRLEELNYLLGSPFFVRCDVVLEGKNQEESLYFGKFGFSENSIYSWVVPASAIRFESPGKVQYFRPDGKIQYAELKRKDQFMIVDGQIKFLASESIGSPRELIYQDQFSNRKTGFVLPEIIAQMEKAQDQVIRANYVGPMVISGPAGSGKTTLALHRVAYLLQSPDLENTFSSDTILVLVQDNGTKAYFSALLPGLGINNVAIHTYSEWALLIIGLQLKYEARFGVNEEEKDKYEYAKLAAINNKTNITFVADEVFETLESVYSPFLDEKQLASLKEQQLAGVIDKIDLTILLRIYADTNGSLGGQKEYYEVLAGGKIKKQRSFVSLDYSLIIVDEFQNYLPEQLSLIGSCINTETKAMVYVGDMAQQVQLGTIKDFDCIKETISDERKIVLQKVYRNTQNILEYIRDLGYQVEIPQGIKAGLPVVEQVVACEDEEIMFIRKTLEHKEYASVGILCKNEDWLKPHRKAFSNSPLVHVLSMNDAQGVEFDLVFLVGIHEKSFAVEYQENVSSKLIEEKQKINRDLLYVALTRAISELYVIGTIALSQVKR
ncbi:MAG: 3'-5' exonuclease [Patescibacteria group bacterium]